MCFYGRLPWRVTVQVPNICLKNPLDTTVRLVLLVGMIAHCRKRNGLKTCLGSVTSIDTAQRQRRRSLLGTILGCWKVSLLSCYLFVRITMIVPTHPKNVISSPYGLDRPASTSLTWLLSRSGCLCHAYVQTC